MSEKTFDVEEISLGELNQGDRIVFKTIADLNEAVKAVDDGNGLSVSTPDGLVTVFPHRLLYQKIYDGTLRMSAKNTTERKEAHK